MSASSTDRFGEAISGEGLLCLGLSELAAFIGHRLEALPSEINASWSEFVTQTLLPEGREQRDSSYHNRISQALSLLYGQIAEEEGLVSRQEKSARVGALAVKICAVLVPVEAERGESGLTSEMASQAGAVLTTDLSQLRKVGVSPINCWAHVLLLYVCLENQAYRDSLSNKERQKFAFMAEDLLEAALLVSEREALLPAALRAVAILKLLALPGSVEQMSTALDRLLESWEQGESAPKAEIELAAVLIDSLSSIGMPVSKVTLLQSLWEESRDLGPVAISAWAKLEPERAAVAYVRAFHNQDITEYELKSLIELCRRLRSNERFDRAVVFAIEELPREIQDRIKSAEPQPMAG